LTAIYSDHVFGDASLYPLALDLHARYALTLLLEPDIPWVADGLQREGSQQRAAVHARIEQALGALQLPYVRLTGSLKLRLLAAERLVQSLR
jgi:nicotinamide riboside kinase